MFNENVITLLYFHKTVKIMDFNQNMSHDFGKIMMKDYCQALYFVFIGFVDIKNAKKDV